MNGQQHYKAAEDLLGAIEATMEVAEKRGVSADNALAAVEVLRARLMGHVGLAQVAATLASDRPVMWNEDYQ